MKKYKNYLGKFKSQSCDTGGKRNICFGNQSALSAKEISEHLDKIPRTRYVEPFLGLGKVYARQEQHAPEEILNDLSCQRVELAKKRICTKGENPQCDRLKKANVNCGKDYKEFLKYDTPDTLYYIDPPYHNKTSGRYENNKLDFNEFVQSVKGIKNAKVAVSYSDSDEFKQAFCNDGFTCHKIRKQNLFKPGFHHDILAVKNH